MFLDRANEEASSEFRGSWFRGRSIRVRNLKSRQRWADLQSSKNFPSRTKACPRADPSSERLMKVAPVPLGPLAFSQIGRDELKTPSGAKAILNPPVAYPVATSTSSLNRVILSLLARISLSCGSNVIATLQAIQGWVIDSPDREFNDCLPVEIRIWAYGMPPGRERYRVTNRRWWRIAVDWITRDLSHGKRICLHGKNIFILFLYVFLDTVSKTLTIWLCFRNIIYIVYKDHRAYTEYEQDLVRWLSRNNLPFRKIK